MAEIKPEALVAPTSPKAEVAVAQAIQGKPGHIPPPPVYPAYKTPAYLPKPPFIDIDGVANFREIGGYRIVSRTSSTESGLTHILRRAFLYRCAHPAQISPEGKTTFSEGLGIKAIYDLRSAPEVARMNAAVEAAAEKAIGTSSSNDPSKISQSQEIPGATRYFTPVFATQDYSPDGLARRLRWYSSGIQSAPPRVEEIGPYSPGFLNAYRDIATHGVPAYTTVFKHILNTPNDPLVFHCTAGKDRTGVLAALILRLAGVDDETICWDYAVTEPGLGAWRELSIDRMASHGLNAGPSPSKTAQTVDGRQVEYITREEAANICSSRAGNMRAFLKFVLDEEFKGVVVYLETKCGFSKDEIDRIRSNLIVPVDEVGLGNIVDPVDIKGWTPDTGVTGTLETLNGH